MAKKKATSNAHVEKKPLRSLEEDTVTVKPHQQQAPAMDSEKIDNLKSLNQMLLKEAVDRRQQIDTLAREKGSLEKGLDRSNKEKDALRLELARLGESVARMDLERAVVADFVAEEMRLKGEDVQGRIEGLEMEMAALRNGIGEKEGEIGRLVGKLDEAEGVLLKEKGISRRVLLEKDEMKNALDLQIEEAKKLKELISESESAMWEMNKRIEELTIAYNGVLVEKEGLEMRFEGINKEKASMVSTLEEVTVSKDLLQEELCRVVREKEAIAEAKSGEMFKREELENVVSRLNEKVAGLQKEEGNLHTAVVLLERQCCEDDKRREEMGREINQLVEEKSVADKRIEWLLDEKNAVEKQLDEANKRVDAQRLDIEHLVCVKNAMEEAKVRLEGEVVQLRNEVAELGAAVLRLKECAKAGEGKIRNLESDVIQYSQKLAVVESEKAEMENRVCEEEKNTAALKQVIVELESTVNKSLDASGKAKAENEALLAEKCAIESECKVLKGKIASLEHSLTEARNEVDSIKSLAQMANARSDRVLNMLKDTVAFCAKDEYNVEDGAPVGDAAKQASDEYAKELEIIQSAFRRKTSKVESMRRELEFLQTSVEEAHKRKGFWTMLSSAVTVLAAVSLAYVARSH